MRVAIYARVSTEAQEARGTIGSQLEVLRKRVAAEGHELVAEYCDDGCSGARLDRPGLDAMRDAAEAGQIEAVWCLSADRLARVYAYQVIVVDELARYGVAVLFHDTPPLNSDPQTQLLTQVQGVIAEYERAKIAERYRRGKLWRARAGEVIAWKCSYGYRRIARTAGQAAHLEVYEPEAAVARGIFQDYVLNNASVRQMIDQLNCEQRQQLLRLVVEQVRVKGWQVEIKLRIPLDGPPDPPGEPVSGNDRLRCLHGQDRAVMYQPVHGSESHRRIGKQLVPRRERLVRSERDFSLVALDFFMWTSWRPSNYTRRFHSDCPQ